MITLIRILVCGLVIASASLAQTVAPTAESPLIQTAHIVGDPNDGFSVSCVIVYSDGRYHRERRKQISESGHAQDRWESPKVFESHLETAEIDRLRAIVETPGFRSVKGTVGNTRNVTSMLLFSPLSVVPHESIEIRTISVAHPTDPQVFEVTETHLAERQEPLRELLHWIKDTESHQAAQLPASAANSCSSLSAANNPSSTSVEMATGLLLPREISAVTPEFPPNTPKPRSIVVEFVVNPDGSVGPAVVKNDVSPDVALPVVEAVRKWRFHPARLLGVPVAFKLETEIKF